MKRNKPTSHSSPKMKPYGRNEDPYDPRDRNKGSTRMEIKLECKRILKDGT